MTVKGNALYNEFNPYITVLFVCCILGGMVAKAVRLPPLLGMLITGCLLRNLPIINVAKDIDTNWSGALR